MTARGALRVVTADAEVGLARRVVAELGRAGHRPAVVGADLEAADGLLVLVDDAALPEALSMLTYLLPGHAMFPSVIVVTEDAEGGAGLLAEGVRDVVGVEDAARAVDAALRGRPPVVVQRLREHITADFVPRLAAELEARALEEQAILGDCLDLMRAEGQLERRIRAVKRRLERQSFDEILVLDGLLRRYLDDLGGGRRLSLARPPRFPRARPEGSLARREPRYRGSRDELEDAVEWLREDDLLRAVGKPGAEALAAIAAEHRDRPLEGLRACRAVVERALADKLALVHRVEEQVDPIDLLEERVLGRRGFGYLAPGIVVPLGVHVVLRSLAHPPPEVYLAYCLDLRDRQLKPCADVLDDILRAEKASGAAPPSQTGEAR